MLRCIPVLLLTAIAIPSDVVAQVISPQKPSFPQAASALPASTSGVLLINTSDAAWKELNRFNPLPAEFFPPFKLPLLSSDLSFSQDIQPWLGEQVAIALLPATSKADSFETNTVLLAPIKDPSNFNAFLARLKGTLGQPQIERNYKGIPILQWSFPGSNLEPPAEPGIPVNPSAPPDQTLSPPLQFSPLTSSRLLPRSQATSFPLQAKAVNPKGNLSTPGLKPQIPPFPVIPSPQIKGTHQVLAIALLPQNIAVATQAQALEKLIDARSEGTSLAQNPLFQRTMGHPQMGRSLLVGYGDIANFARHLANFYSTIPGLTSFLPPLDDSQISQITRVYNTIDTHLWVQPEGIHGQTNFYYTKSHPALANSNQTTPNQILTRLPAATYLSANSRNFKQQWQSLTQAGQMDAVTQQFVVGLRNTIPGITGLDLERDLVPWMDGEYTFFLFPTTGGLFNYISPDFNLGLGLMVQTSDRPAAEAALKKLDRFIRSTSKGDVEPVPRRIKGQPVISWEGRERDQIYSVLAHGWVDRDTLIITTGSGAMATLNPKPYLPLHLNYTFKTATGSLPTPNQGYFYVNMGASLAFVYGLVLPSLPRTYTPFVQQVQQVLGTLRSVSTTTSVTPEAQRVDSLWVLGSVDRVPK
ncbi:MAG: DUF3352 domain-containing protein [Kovacikia sp.]